MNRFKTKRRVKDDFSAGRSSQDGDSSKGFRFRKAKKSMEEPKPEIDLSHALPSSDDFRTSLLMTGLSARFSLLKEQDDPNTKIGKASDDSVLFSKRQSRMTNFGALTGLSDIAEVESITTPPFARKESFNSDADSTSGSIMGRAKPTEGNNLFGGRQKIYKIPAGSASAKALNGSMGGKALYDDDVSMSAFQKWKKAEKERQAIEEEQDEVEDVLGRPSNEEHEEPEARPESPYSGGYSRKRETSSTLSSVPSVTRNSTAATSVTSQQPTPSLKDWQSSSTAPTSASSTPALERNLTSRVRRLYETGLSHDLQEQQSSAFSRIDTLARRRNGGASTPDLGPMSPSVGDRFSGERRIVAMGSAPNLRSMSPIPSGRSSGTSDLGIRYPSGNESRPTFGGVPPLSPPISETEEISALSIRPGDRGKATALGVFQKPSQPYDESRYAQRQVQLQQGRETPTQRFRAGSNASSRNGRSTSSSSLRRLPLEAKPDPSFPKIQPPLKEEDTSFLSDDSDSPVVPSRRPMSPRLRLRRPSDSQHPAFRDSAMPTPLSCASKDSAEPSPTIGLYTPPPPSAPKSQASPVDSPTLGPATGLSGMVRQHLRAASGASSVYDADPDMDDADPRGPLSPKEAKGLHDIATHYNLSRNQDGGINWNSPDYDDEPESEQKDQVAPLGDAGEGNANITGRQVSRESVEFASQLAEGRRRIRERLTSYVESDSRSSSPQPSHDGKDMVSSLAPLRLGGLLRSKSSRGELNEKKQDVDSNTKAMKMLGLGGPSDSPHQDTSHDEPHRNPVVMQAFIDNPADKERNLGESKPTSPTGPAEPPGLRAFRQARRELQKLKELETQQRHNTQPGEPPQGPIPDVPEQIGTPTRESASPPAQQRSPIRERRAPPVAYQHRGPHEQSSRSSSRSGSRDPAERDRSGSESNRLPPRMGAAFGPHNDHPLGHPAMRSAGLPGTDVKGSPIMPPQGYPTAPQARFNHQLGYQSAQPSPVSPMPSPYVSSGPSTPVPAAPPQRPAFPQAPAPLNSDGSEIPGLNDAMKRSVKKRDISEPTFVMSTFRVPTVALPPEAAANRSRSNSRSNSKPDSQAPPPVPPINPRRRRESSKTRTLLESLRGGHEMEVNQSMPNLPRAASHDHIDGGRMNSTFSVSDEEEPKPERRRLRKMTGEGPASPAGMGARNRPPVTAPPFNPGPHSSRMFATKGMGNMPGGMI